MRAPNLTVTISPNQPARYEWDRSPKFDDPTVPHEFYLTRAVYTNSGGWGRRRRGKGWYTDYPKADRPFLIVLPQLIDIDSGSHENAVRLDDPELRRFPFLYALEVGYMAMTEPEVEGLRNYLLAGGFLMVDDFWGSWEWE